MQTLQVDARTAEPSGDSARPGEPRQKLQVKDVLAKAEALLRKDKVASGVLSFQPHTLLSVQKAFDHSTWGMIKASVRGSALPKHHNSGNDVRGNTDAVLASHRSNSKQPRGDQLSEYDNRDSIVQPPNGQLDVTYPRVRPSTLGHDESGISLGSGDLRPGISILDDEVIDLGTNILVTYFLHALEILRLVQVNKELVQDSVEMDTEIQTLESRLSEVQAVKESIRQSFDIQILPSTVLVKQIQKVSEPSHEESKSISSSSEGSMEEQKQLKNEFDIKVAAEVQKALNNLKAEHEKYEANLKLNHQKEMAKLQEVSDRAIQGLESKIRELQMTNRPLQEQKGPKAEPQYSIQVVSRPYASQNMPISSESNPQSSGSASQQPQKATMKVPQAALNLCSLDKIVGSHMGSPVAAQIPLGIPPAEKPSGFVQHMPIEVSMSAMGSSSATLLTAQVQRIISTQKAENSVPIAPQPIITVPSPRASVSRQPQPSTYRPMMGGGLARNASRKTLTNEPFIDSGRNSYMSGQARSTVADLLKDQRPISAGINFYEALSQMRQETEYSVYPPQRPPMASSQRDSYTFSNPPQMEALGLRRLVLPSTPNDLQKNHLEQSSERAMSVSGSVDKGYAPSAFTYKSGNASFLGGFNSSTPYTPGAVFSDIKQHLKNFGNPKPKQESFVASNTASAFQVVQAASKHQTLQSQAPSNVSNYFTRERQQLALMKPQDRTLNSGNGSSIQSSSKMNSRTVVPASPIAFRNSMMPAQSSSSQHKPPHQGPLTMMTPSHLSRPTATPQGEQFRNPETQAQTPLNAPSPNPKGHLTLLSNPSHTSVSYSSYLNSPQSYLLRK